MIGSAVGFANILSFSAQCYKNGGGAFLIPFLLANLVIGLPLLFLEGIIGQKYGLPLVSCYGQSQKNYAWKSFGWLAAFSCLTIGSFYSVLTAWSVTYAYFSFKRAIPEDPAKFFEMDFLKLSSSLSDFGSLSIPILFCTIFVMFFSWQVVHKSINKGIEQACSIFMPLLLIILLIFSAVVCFLPGFEIGIYNFLSPDFEKLKDFKLWRDVFGHVFFSLSLGIGIVIGYSRHTKQDIDIKKAMLWVVAGDVLVSFVAGFAIFGCVGFMSQKTGLPFNEIVKSDSTFQMGFVIFPQILQSFPYAIQPIIGVAFFFCVFIAGITGVFSIIESLAGNLEIELGLSRKKAVTITSLVMFLLSIFFCMGNSLYILSALSPMVLGYTFLIGGITQILFFIFKNKTISDHVIWQKNVKGKNIYYKFLHIGLLFLIISLFGSLYEESKEVFNAAHYLRWSWLAAVLFLSYLAAYKIHRQKY